jgi:Metallo-beta-lactamase superfamily
MSQAPVSAERAFEQVKGMVAKISVFRGRQQPCDAVELPPPGPYEPQTLKVSCSAEGRPAAAISVAEISRRSTQMNCEIEFLPVGEASRPGDAIVVRYGDTSSYELMIVDGGNLDSGKALVTHVRNHFGNNSVISHVVLTHADADHASGLRVVLSELPVVNLWMHVPWAFAAATRPYFANKNWTVDALQEAIRKEYDVLIELVQLAAGGRQITLQSPFAGATIGPFRVLSPHRDVYPVLLPQFDRTPDPDQKAIEATGWWIGKQPGMIARILERVKAKAQTWVTETWSKEL